MHLNKEKESNFIIISKPRVNTTKNVRNYLTLKEGDFSLKININNSPSNSKLTQQKILQTLSDIKKHMPINNTKKIKKRNNKFLKESSIKFNENIEKKPNKTTDEKNNVEDNIGDLIINDDESISNNENNTNKNKNNIIKDNKYNKSNKEFSSIIIGDDKLSEIKKGKDNLKEIEKNFVSSINKKSCRTQLNKKEKQKSIQQSDRAEVSKESDNVTELDNKLKLLVKLKDYNSHSINVDINEKQEIENEIIDNEKNMIKVLNNNNNENKGERLIFNKDTLTMKKNKFLNDIIEKNEKSEIINDNSNNKNSDEIKEIKNNNKVNLIEISKDNKISNEGSIGNDNISENKQLIKVIIPRIVIKNKLSDSQTKEKNKIKKVKKKSIIVVSKQNIKKLENSNVISSNRDLLKNENNKTIFRSVQLTQKNCYICEKPFYLNRLYCADCSIHFLCRKCLKNYYEDYIENNNNITILKCPNTICNKTINYEIVKHIISESHQQIYEKVENNYNLINKNDLIFNSIKLDKYNDNNVKLYSEKHVLDISSNMNFFMFKKSKDIFCPKCLNPNLFSKTNNQFIKCLNCNYKICKYCLKEYTAKHLDIKFEGYCKVYFRRDSEDFEQKSKILFYLLQLFFVIAMYIFTYCGAFLFFYNKFKIIVRLNSHNKNFFYNIKKVLIILFSILFYIISCPFILVCYPFFPAIIALFDF